MQAARAKHASNDAWQEQAQAASANLETLHLCPLGQAPASPECGELQAASSTNAAGPDAEPDEDLTHALALR